VNCAIVGAGRTGRGFLARLLGGQASLAFIDRDADLVEALHTAGLFGIRYFDGSAGETVRGYRAFHVDDPACEGVLAAADAVFIAVGAGEARAAGAWLSGFRLPECVVACENAACPAELLGDPLRDTALSGAVFCTTVEEDGLNLASERYPALHVSDGDAAGALRGLRGVIVERDFDTLMRRKLYTYNGASGLIAYLGAEKGIEDYAWAARDRNVAAQLTHFYEQVNAAICAEYGVDPIEQAEFAAFSRAKFENRAVSDSVARNAADPARKLSPDDRIIAPARLILKHGGDAGPSARTAAAALRYMGVRARGDAEAALRGVCGLEGGEPLFAMVLEMFV